VSVPVQTGISDGINTQIVSGLQPGDQVVTGVVTSGSTKSSSGSSGTSIFGFGGPGGGGNNNNANRQSGVTAQRGG
jgi:HlyD family secretion protein